MWVICSWFEQIARIKRAIHFKKLYFLYFFLQLFPFLTVCLRALHSCCSSLVHSLVNSDLIDLLLWLFTKEQPEQFAQVTHDRRATMSDSLRLLMIMTKEWQERFAFFHERIALSLTKNEGIKKLMSKFPTLIICVIKRTLEFVQKWCGKMQLHQCCCPQTN